MLRKMPRQLRGKQFVVVKIEFKNSIETNSLKLIYQCTGRKCAEGARKRSSQRGWWL